MNIDSARTVAWFSARPLIVWVVALVLLCGTGPRPAFSQQADSTRRDTIRAPEITAGEADGERKRRQAIEFSELDFGFTTFRFGAGLLFDAAAYSQDDESLLQFQPNNDSKLRDARFLVGGSFKTKRPFSWQAGIMWDQVKREWLFRQTGLMIAVPELWGRFFVGRAKEGFSLNKVMVGYDGWGMERHPFTDATVPLLADGIKWLGNAADRHVFWNLGAFTDWISEGQTFSSYEHQFVARFGWVPLVSDSIGTLLHIGFNFRTGQPNEDSLRLRSKPESFTAPYFVDTGTFPATSVHHEGVEVYYRPGRLLFGAEYSFQHVNSPETGNPSFHGGEFVFAWLTTGETRSYNTLGNYFRAVSPKKTVVEGGPGAWEAVLKFSYADLTDGTLEGGRFWRLTPMLNWHLTDNVRLEMGYGYGTLLRFGMKGRTHFFQVRTQMQL